MFGGDFLISHISSNALVEPNLDGERIESLSQHARSYETCLSLELELVYSGHGQPITNPHDLIKRRLAGLDKKAEKFLALVSSGKRTGSEIAQAYYKETYDQQFALVMSEVIGHLDYLEKQGKVKKELVQGVWHYVASCAE